MRRLGLALLLFTLLASRPAAAAITFVQAVSCIAIGVTSCTTSAITTTTGNLVVTASGWCCAPTDFSAVSDSKSNAWTNGIPTQDQGPTEGRADYNGALTTGGGSHTFTLTFTTGTSGVLGVVEISGQAASPLDKTAANVVASATNHTTPATATTSQANEILVGFGTTTDTLSLSTDTGAGWTERANAVSGGDFVGFVMGTKIVAATGTYAYTWTTPTNARHGSGIMTFKEAAAAAGVRQRCVGCGADGKVIE